MTSLASPLNRSLLTVSHWLYRTSDPSAGDRVTPIPTSFTVPPPRRPRRVRRTLTAAALISGVAGVVGAVVIKQVPAAGPLVADTLRSIVGVDNVVKLEEAAAGVDDRLHQFSSAVSAPRDTAQALAVEPAPPTSEPSSSFSLAPLSRMHKGVAADSDGRWIPIRAESEKASDAPRMLLTLVHPDWHRAYSELFIVALDATRVNLHAVPGTTEPLSASPSPEAKALLRTGLIPDADRGALLGAFNGGFKTVHGQYGMQVGGVTVLPAQRYACTVGLDAAGQLRIARWERGTFAEGSWQWWRQTPPCLYENGKMHPGLASDDNLAWGAALKGSTVTRRSAIGVSHDGKVIYVGIGNELTARTLAAGMSHAGAADIAQLDINWSYPRFVVFKTGEAGELDATSLLRGFNVGADDYLREANPRDFFYVTAK